jgi:hypothetical protein
MRPNLALTASESVTKRRRTQLRCAIKSRYAVERPWLGAGVGGVGAKLRRCSDAARWSEQNAILGPEQIQFHTFFDPVVFPSDDDAGLR